MEDLITTFNPARKTRFEEAQGVVCATGYILAQCMTGMPTVPINKMKNILSSLVHLRTSGNPLLSGTVVEAVGHIGLRGCLPLFSDGDEQYIGVETMFSGHICHDGPEKILLVATLNVIFALSRTTVEEVLFSVGEAICFIWGGLD